MMATKDSLLNKEKSIIIMLTGMSGAGKDTCADGLNGFTKYAFADKLKAQCASRYMLPLDAFYTQKNTPIIGDKTPRDICILEGTCARTICPDIWAQHVRAQIVDMIGQHGPGSKFVISDCRYQNEIDVLKSIGIPVFVVRIKRNTCMQMGAPDAEENIKKIDVTLYNNGSVSELHKEMNDLVNTLIKLC